MYNYRFISGLIFLTFVFVACKTSQASQSLRTEHEAWIQQRISGLTSPTGWLSLVGLHWLKPGANFFGSGDINDIRFPEPAAPTLGTFYLEKKTVRVEIPTDVEVTINGEKITNATLTGQEETLLMQHQSFQWYLLERAGQFGIRVRDTLLPSRVLLEPIERYPFDKKWRVDAEYQAFSSPKTRTMRNVLDMDIPVEISGVLVFQIDGEEHRLEVLDGGPDDFFIIFSDNTTGDITYGGGRYIYTPRPNDKGQTVIDFNRAYNPPCAFTDFATCLLPRAENNLEVAVLAGEKTYGHH